MEIVLCNDTSEDEWRVAVRDPAYLRVEAGCDWLPDHRSPQKNTKGLAQYRRGRPCGTVYPKLGTCIVLGRRSSLFYVWIVDHKEWCNQSPVHSSIQGE